jgi:hypothetical protein
MDCRGADKALRRTVEEGRYVVDSRAVAEAILRSRVLVATEARDRAVRAEKDQAATG